MEEQPPDTVSAATGALGPVLCELTTLLGDEQHRSSLGARTLGDIESIRSLLASLHSLLLRIWERDDLGAQCKKWMTDARALSYDIEDDIDDLMLGLKRGDDVGHGGLHEVFQNLKMRVEAVSRRCLEEWKTTTTAPDEAISNCNKHSKPSPADPRSRFLHKDVWELVGMHTPFLELSRLLRDHEMVCIHGFAGTSKTTLADMVYQEIGNEFECRAFIALSKRPDMMEVLGAILTQVTEGVQSVERTCTEATPEENLIHDISMFLSGKRYMLIVDDIWLWQSWEIIRRALPKGNRLCRIIATTRVGTIAEKWCLTEEGIYRHSGIDARAASGLSQRKLQDAYYRWRLHIDKNAIANICGGMTLAVRCLSSFVKETIRKRMIYNDDELWRELLDGLHRNNLKLRPMVESLRLGYDDLPVHVKTCLLYCSIFPTGYKIERHGLVRKWITHGFLPQGPEQEKEAAAKACLDELVSRGLLQQELASSSYCSVHPMMRAFLLWRSNEAKFATCPHDCPSSYYGVGAGSDGAPRFLGLAGSHTISASSVVDGSPRARSIVVFGYSSSGGGSSSSRTHTDDGCLFPWQKMQHVRVLSIEDNRVSLSATDLVAICTWMLRLRHLSLKGMPIRVVPPEIGRLQNLETLDVSDTGVREIPKEIGKLHQLKTLNVPAMVSELPCLSSGSVSVLAGGKEVELSHRVSALMQSWKKKETSASSLLLNPGEDLSIVLHVRPGQYLLVPGLKVGSRHIRVPEWIKQHLADISFLDIRLYKLEQDDLKFLSTMPNLQVLTLRLLYLPREPTVLAGTGFSRLESFCLDCRSGSMRVPGWVKQHLANVSSLDIRLRKLEPDDLEFLRTMPNLQLLTLRLLYLPSEPTVLTGTGFSRLESFCLDCRSGSMRVPGWVKQHLANVSSLDIRLCQLVDDDLDFLRNKMPHLQLLTLRLEVLPSKAIVITGAGFSRLESFCLDCRLPMVTFQQGAMPNLEHLEFKFYTSRALTNKDPVGIRHLLSLRKIVFNSSPRYKSDAPGISSVINKVRQEAKEHPNKITISINGKDEEVIQEKMEATKRTSASDMISEENIVTSGGAGGSSGAGKIKTSLLPSPYDNGSDDEKGSIIPVKSYYPFGVTK